MQSFTDCDALSVRPLSSVVKVAVLFCDVHVPIVPVTSLEYLKVVGLGSEADTVPSEPPIVSLTDTLSSTFEIVAFEKSTAAVPNSPEDAVAVFVPAAGRLL